MDTVGQWVGDVKVCSVEHTAYAARAIHFALLCIVQALEFVTAGLGILLISSLLFLLRLFKVWCKSIGNSPLGGSLRGDQHTTFTDPMAQTLYKLLGEALIGAIDKDDGCIAIEWRTVGIIAVDLCQGDMMVVTQQIPCLADGRPVDATITACADKGCHDGFLNLDEIVASQIDACLTQTCLQAIDLYVGAFNSLTDSVVDAID